MTARLRGPGFPRAGAFLLLGVLFSAALVIVVRELYGFDTFAGGDLLTGKAQNAILLVSLIAAPLFFLVGLGAFDYWFYWASGRPTRPEDHSGRRLSRGLRGAVRARALHDAPDGTRAAQGGVRLLAVGPAGEGVAMTDRDTDVKKGR